MPTLIERLQSAVGDRYRVERELGRGGMASVFLAADLRHARPVAIKVLDPQTGSAIGAERFAREIEAVSRLTHPHVLPLYDSGHAGDLLWYVMPYVTGESLRHRLAREGPLPIDEALRLAREVADALECAHRAGLVHRDIKPENVLLESGHAVVADFGLARTLDPAVGRLTSQGVVVGTPAYMSPEQAAGEREVDARSDQYSLACTLYEMLAGLPPFAGPHAQALLHQHLNVTPRPVTELRPAVSPDLGAALAKALAKVPADRFTSVAAFAAALGAPVQGDAGVPGARAALESAPTEDVRLPADGAPSARAPAASAGRRTPAVAFTFAALVLAVVAFLAWQRWAPARPAAPAAKSWILVAEFAAPREEPDLAPAARGLLCTALDQSGIVMTVPPDQVALALEQAGRPDSTRVDGRLARELAFRNSIRSVLEGRLNRIGAGYHVAVRLSDSRSDSTLLALDATARDRDALVRTLDGLARRLRRALGENPGAVRATRQLYVAATPSFEAYRRFEAEERYVNETGDYVGGLAMSRQTLALDPDFATEYGEVAVSYSMVGMPDSAVWALDQALARPQRLTDEQRLHFEARRAYMRGDFEGAVVLRRRQLELWPSGPKAFSAWHELELAEAFRGHFTQAVEAGRRCVESQPVGASPVTLQVLAAEQLNAGQLDDAAASIDRLHGWWRLPLQVRLAVARDDWARAESLYANPPADLAGDERIRSGAAWFRASLMLRRGEARAARAAIAENNRMLARRRVTGRPDLQLAIVTGAPTPPPPAFLAGDSTERAAITRGWYAAQAGDSTAVRREVAALRHRGADALARAGAAPDFLEAVLAGRAGRWRDVLDRIGPAALRGDDRGSGFWGRIGPWNERWLVAQAYEHLGMTDSAVVAYERVLALSESRATEFGPYAPYVRQRLVLLCADLGRRAEAEKHWWAFASAFTHPDPELKYLLDEARAAVLRLRSPEERGSLPPPPAKRPA